MGIYETTVSRHISDFITAYKLTPENGGSTSLLNDAQTHVLIEHLSAYIYFHTYQIANYIREQWELSYSIPGLNK
ncbi:hypothetical protein [Pseudoalteromonas sp. NBT06-2]|uniref:hypothetical protein n=1 Tax=Pseudoalteromonas sp. NBT06-2 TaxID=2025950 RepID=UPI0011410E81|nr:hypothetical protein [Pseudoalteromonas sp. NBT06-2]